MYIEGQGEIVQSLAADVFFTHGWNTCNIRVHRSFSRAKELYYYYIKWYITAGIL